MKKEFGYTSVVAGLLLSNILMCNTAEVEAADVSNTSSIGTISYVIDNSITDPLDPLDPDPDKPITPTDPGDHKDPAGGPLSIDWVSNIRFGEQNTTGSDKTYYASLEKVFDSDKKEKEVPAFVQVTDKRGSNAGWHLTVTQDTQFMNGKEELTGAVMTLKNGTLSSPDKGIAPTANQEIVLQPQKAVDVLNAKVDEGTGTWLNRFGSDNNAAKSSISLSVPGKTKKVEGEYKTSLTWVLADTPA